MHDEDDFLRRLSESPADDTIRMVYADWLDERGDEQSKAKARFLRVTVQLMGPIQRVGWRRPREYELQHLAAALPTDWLAVVSRLKVEGCPAKAEEQARGLLRHLFEFVCDRRWDEMTPTGDNSVRFCEQCRENVHYCDTIMVAREHARQGHCVAIDLGIIRRHNDLAPRRSIRGRMRPDQAAFVEQQERERLEPDEVSREREERKRQQKEE